MYRWRYPAINKKNITATLNLFVVIIIEVSSRFNRLSNELANKALSPWQLFFSTQKHSKTQSTKIAKPSKLNKNIS